MFTPLRRALALATSLAALLAAAPSLAANAIVPAAPIEVLATPGGPDVTAPVGVTDPDGDTLALTLAPGLGPKSGVVHFDDDAGTFTYTPDAQGAGDLDRFVIRIDDGQGWVRFRHVTVTFQRTVAGAALGDTITGGYASDQITGGGGVDLLFGDPAPGAVTEVERVSKPAAGGNANGNSFDPVFAPDGGAVLFTSSASNLVTGVSGTQVFRRDLASGAIELVSQGLDPNGQAVPGDGASGEAAVAPDGVGIAFSSLADNIAVGSPGYFDVFRRIGTDFDLVSTNQASPANSVLPVFTPDGSALAFSSNGTFSITSANSGNVFLLDLQTGTISVASTGADGPADTPDTPDRVSFSQNGKQMVFSTGSSLSAVSGVPLGHPGIRDVYLKNLETGQLSLVSISQSGFPAAADSDQAVLSPDGTRVAFRSSADNLDGGAAGTADIFVKNLTTGAVTLVSSAADGEEASGDSETPVFSPDGTLVAFVSESADLVPGSPGTRQVYVKDLVTGEIVLASRNTLGAPADGPSFDPVFSPDGARLAFTSLANNLDGGAAGTQDVFVVTLAPLSGGDDTISGGADPDEIYGGKGNDTLEGGLGDDYIDGGPGTDTAVYGTPRRRYEVLQSLNGDWFVSDLADPAVDGADALEGIELLSFGGVVQPLGPAGNNKDPVAPATINLHVAHGETTAPVVVEASDPDGDPLSLSLVGSNETVTITSATGPTLSFTYTAPGGFAVDSFALRVSDPWQGSKDILVNVVIDGFIEGTADDNVLDGAGGDDVIIGGGGADTLTGGGGNDVLDGGDGADTLAGGDGNDTLNGGPQPDQMSGGPGDDTYVVDNPADTVVELPDQGNDMVVSMVDLGPDVELPANVEVLALGFDPAMIHGVGNLLDNRITGNAGTNKLDGRDGNDRIEGAGGDDVLVGGDGTDRAVYADGPRRRYEVVAGQGPVTVIDRAAGSPMGADILDGIEGLLVAGAPFPLDPADNNKPPSLPPALTISVKQGGTVTVDVPAVDPDGDALVAEVVPPNPRVKLAAGALVPSLTYTTDPAVKSFEQFAVTVKDPFGGEAMMTVSVLIGETMAGGAGDDLIEGGAGDDTIAGGGGADSLFGKEGDDRLDGGAGADAMIGGAGDDVYVVDDPKDTVSESAGAGKDTVEASISFTLPAEVENLTLTGTGNIAGTGNAGANRIVGNAGNNVLRGLGGDDEILGLAGNDLIEGGPGVDKLDGGPGADTLSFAGSAAAVTANLANGTIAGDTVTGFESLEGSRHADTLTGNGGANVLAGGGGNDTLSGGGGADVVDGGAGADVLTGGAGRDVFRFSVGPVAKAVDAIRDFSLRDDRIHLENAVFKGVGKGTAAKPGKLAASRFKVGRAATAAGHRIVHDRATGTLRYDPDGTGPKKSVPFAKVKKGLRLTVEHFRVY